MRPPARASTRFRSRLLDRPAGARRGPPPSRGGFTLLELLVGLTLLGLVAGTGITAYRELRAAAALDAARRVAAGELARARMLAVSRREVVRLRLGDGRLVLTSADGDTLSRTGLFLREFGLDSARLAPRTLRFNSRGQAAPGSVYLYRGSHGVRLVSNFLGRVRVERFRL